MSPLKNIMERSKQQKVVGITLLLCAMHFCVAIPCHAQQQPEQKTLLLDKIVEIAGDQGLESGLGEVMRLANEYAAVKDATGNMLLYPSKEIESVTFADEVFRPPHPEGEEPPPFLYGLAILSDDGCTVTINGKKVLTKFGEGQALPDLKQSLHILPVILSSGTPANIKVEYSNIIYRVNAKEPDIDGVTLFVYLLPVEIVMPEKYWSETDKHYVYTQLPKPKLVSVNELVVATLQDAIHGITTLGTGTPRLEIDDEVDRFYIRMPGLTGTHTVSLKVGTVDNPETRYNDIPHEIELVEKDEAFITPSLLLVADEEDDAYSGNGVGTDNNKNDRTLLVQLGGKLQIKSITIDGKESNVDMRIPVPAKKTVKVHVYNCQKGWFTNGPCWTPGDLERALRRMKERFAQSRIKVEIVGPDPGIWVGPTGGVNGPSENPGYALDIPSESKDLFTNAAMPVASDEIGMYFVDNMSPISRGATTMPSEMAASQIAAGYANKCIVAFKTEYYVNDWELVAAHELMHVLLDAIHSKYPTEFGDPTMLWHATSVNYGIGATKRISELQCRKNRSSPFAK